MLYPEALNRDPNAAPTSGRLRPYVAAPMGIAAPPLPGKAQTCTASTPVPLITSASNAQPATVKAPDTEAVGAGVSTYIKGAPGGRTVIVWTFAVKMPV